MFTDQLKFQIHRSYMDNIGIMGSCKDGIVEKMELCSGDLLTVMEFYYSGMSAEDIGGYGFAFLQSIAEHALDLESKFEWVEQIPERILLNSVLNYRVELERIEDDREFFYQSLKKRISCKTMKQTAMEAANWCAEHVEISPMESESFSALGILKAGCGDSRQIAVLTAEVLRSVAIPARVVQIPAWAHRDGSFSWVEAWYEGQWNYMETYKFGWAIPKNWFLGVAARAMVIQTNAASPREEEETFNSAENKAQNNLLSRYAPTVPFTVTVLETEKPLPGAQVRFELVNGADFRQIAAVTTDENGMAGLTLGSGSVHIHAVKDGRWIQCFVNTAQSDSVVLEFSKSVSFQADVWEEFTMTVPKNPEEFFVSLTEIQKAKMKSESQWTAQARKDYLACCYLSEQADRLAARFYEPERVQALLQSAKGNFEEIARFLMTYEDTKTQSLKLDFLGCLQEQDLCGTHADMLSEHFQAALPHRERYEKNILIRYLMNPRIWNEPLMPYRAAITAVLGSQSTMIQKNPRLAWHHAALFPGGKKSAAASPAATLRVGGGDETAKKIVFVAICRTFGIPARINPVDFSAEFYYQGDFHSVEERTPRKKNAAELTLRSGGKRWSYGRDWTMAMMVNGTFRPLNFSELQWEDGKLKLAVHPGTYRIITAARMTSGDVNCLQYHFELEGQETKSLELHRQETTVPMLSECVPLNSFRLYSQRLAATELSRIAEKVTVSIWLEEEMPETEELLNAMIRARSAFNALNCGIIFILREHAASVSALLSLAQRELGAQIYAADFDESALLTAIQLGLDPEKIPLTLVTGPGLKPVYTYAGYEEGLADLVIQAVQREISAQDSGALTRS